MCVAANNEKRYHSPQGIETRRNIIAKYQYIRPIYYHIL